MYVDCKDNNLCVDVNKQQNLTDYLDCNVNFIAN